MSSESRKCECGGVVGAAACVNCSLALRGAVSSLKAANVAIVHLRARLDVARAALEAIRDRGVTEMAFVSYPAVLERRPYCRCCSLYDDDDWHPLSGREGEPPRACGIASHALAELTKPAAAPDVPAAEAKPVTVSCLLCDCVIAMDDYDEHRKTCNSRTRPERAEQLARDYMALVGKEPL